MRDRFVWLVLLLIIFSSLASASILGSKHDLRGSSSFGNPQEVCKVCHIPHLSTAPAYLAAPGRVYAGGTLTFYGGSVGQPTNSSQVCLSCHDGTLAPSVGTTSTDYTHTHPFSVVYPTRTGYAPAVAGQITGAYGTVKIEGTGNKRIECGTCHNPHEKGISQNFLVIENTNSNLCLTCHQK